MRILAILGFLSTAAWCHSALPVAFEPNRGQETGSFDFVGHGKGYALSLRAARTDLVTGQTRLATVLAGARGTARGEAEAKLPGVVNYLKGNDRSRWITNVPTFERVRYLGIYPGIDVVYYGKEGRLEYDFIVAPGADPGKIRMRFEGARSVTVGASGDLLIETGDGTLRQHPPVVYQETGGARHEIAGRYLLRGRTVRFELARYDRKRALVIDPALTWATYLGGTNSENGEGVALDSSGNIYVTGTTSYATGGSSVFFSKLNPAGTSAVFSTVYGGSYDDEAHGIAVDAAGNIYLVGDTDSPDYPADTTYLTYYPGYSLDAYVTKIDPTGTTIVYSHFFGGSGDDAAYGVALDSATNAYVVGATVSTNFPVSSGVAQTSEGGGVDAFVIKFNASGALAYSTYLGGSSDEYGNAIAVDSAGDAFVAGSTASSNFPVTSSAVQPKLAGGTDAFVTKLSPSGTLVFSTYLGGSLNDGAFGIAIDSSGAAYITGETASTDFPTLGPVQPAFGGGAYDMFVTKLDGSGAFLVYSTYLGGSAADAAYAITVDGGGNAYVGGISTSTDFPVSDAFQQTNQGPSNGIVAALNASGSALLFSSYLGGSGSGTYGDWVNALATNCAAGLVAVGTTTSTNFPATQGSYMTTFQGGTADAFVARIAAGGGTPAIATGGVVNAATSAAGPVAPGSLITIYGSNLALATAMGTLPWPTTLAGASVTINGTPAPINYASASQINVQLPYEAGAGTAAVTVGGTCGNSVMATFQVAQAAPYIFQSATGDAIVQNQDYSVNGPTNPAASGTYVTVYLTGIGPLDNPVATGAPAPSSPLSRATLPKSATIGGWTSSVAFLGLTPGFIGLAQANLQVPSLSPGAYPVVITVNGVSSNGPNVYVH